MTKIAERRTKMQAETSARYRGTPLVVLLNGHDIYIREKGRRTAFAVPFVCVYELGMKLAANERRREKIEAKKARKQ